MDEVIVDVRERDEFEAEHVECSINVPFSHFATVAPGVLRQLQGRRVVLMCQSGPRARLAFDEIKNLGYSDGIQASVYEGGIQAWKREGKPTLVHRTARLPLMRQVQLVVGLLVLASVALAVFVNPWFLAATAFFGAGLTVAGATGFCGMAILLSKMPWNSAGERC